MKRLVLGSASALALAFAAPSMAQNNSSIVNQAGTDNSVTVD